MSTGNRIYSLQTLGFTAATSEARPGGFGGLAPHEAGSSSSTPMCIEINPTGSACKFRAEALRAMQKCSISGSSAERRERSQRAGLEGVENSISTLLGRLVTLEVADGQGGRALMPGRREADEHITASMLAWVGVGCGAESSKS